MIFYCLYGPCGHIEDFPESEPEVWHVKRYPLFNEYAHRCARCGAAMAPEFFVKKGGTLVFDAVAYECFSRCPVAGFCMLHDQYAPDCEQGVLKSKCLLSLHEGLESLSARLENIEKRLQGKGRSRPAKKRKGGSDTQPR